MIKQILVLFGICLASVVLSGVLPVMVPASVLAMLALILLLGTGLVKEKHVAGLCDFFKENMAFLFIPAGIGAAENLEILKESGLELVVICAVGTLLTFVATAFTVKGVLALTQKRKEHK